MKAMIPEGSIVQPGAGRVIAGLGALAKVSAGTFDGRVFMFEGTIEPGAFIPPHTHTHEDEVSMVLSGAMTVDVGGQLWTAEPGALVVKPRGVHHSMWNHTDVPTRVLEVFTPGRLEPYFDALGELFSARGVEEVERQRAIIELHTKYGIIYHPELVPEVVAADGRRPHLVVPGGS